MLQTILPPVPPAAIAAAQLSVYSKRVDAAAFYASGSNQQTTGTIASGSNVLTLAAPLDFLNGQGVRVPGAGTGGNGSQLLATILSGAGTTSLTLSASATASVSAVTVFHDDTAAVLAMLSYAQANNGIQVDFGAGQYNIGGSPQNPSTSNAILPLPAVTFGSDYTIDFRGTAGVGFFREVIPNAPPLNGVVFNFPYICPNAGSTPIQGIGFAPFYAAPSNTNITYLNLWLSNISFQVPANSGYIVVGGQAVQNTIFEKISVFTPVASSSITLPTNTKETGIALGGNSCMAVARQCYVQGLYNGITPGVHAVLDGCFIQSCVVGISIFAGDHAQCWNKVLIQNCQWLIGRNPNDLGAGPVATVLGFIDSEVNTTPGAPFQYQGFIKNAGTGTGQLDLNGIVYYRLENTGSGTQPANSGINIFNPGTGGSCKFVQIGSGGGESIQSTGCGGSPYTFALSAPAQILLSGSGLTGVTITRNGNTVTVPVVNTVGGVPSANINMVKGDSLVITWTGGTAPLLNALPLQ